MGKYINIILALLILVIVTAVSSSYSYKRGQEKTWELAQQLVPIQKDEVYLCVEKTDANGLSFLTVQEISAAINDKSNNRNELRFRLKLALDGVNLQDYNNKYRGGKKGF